MRALSLESFSRIRSKSSLLIVALLLLVALFYIRAVNAPLLLDDLPEMALVNSAGSLWSMPLLDCYQFFRPIKNLVFATFVWLSPWMPWVGHLLSLFLFEICVFLLWRYYQVLFRNDSWALTATALWALAPTQVAVVSWLSCINILTMTACVIGCLLFHEQMQRTAPGRLRNAPFLKSLACLLPAMCSYELAVVTPALVVLHDAYVDRQRLRARSSWLRYVALAGVAFAYLVLRFVIGNKTVSDNQHFAPVNAIDLSLSSAYFIVDHLTLWFMPFGRQTILRTFDFGAPDTPLFLLGSWLLLAVLLVAVWLARNKAPTLTFSVGIFLVAFAPVSNAIPLFSGPFGDYYLMLPSIGLSFGIVAALRGSCSLAARLGAHAKTFLYLSRCAVLAFAIWFVLMACETLGWIPSWKSEKALMQATLAVRPETYTARVNLAHLLAESGSTPEAEKLAREAVLQAPWYVQGFCVLADVLMKEGKNEDALQAAQRAQQLQPTAVYPFVLIGHLQELMEDSADAEKAYRDALDIPWDPEQSATAALNLGAIYAESKRLDEATQVWKMACERAPRNAMIHYNLAVACFQAKDFDSAWRHVTTAQQLGLQVDSKVFDMLRRAARQNP